MNIFKHHNLSVCLLALLCNISAQSMEPSNNNRIGWQNLSRDLKKKILNQCLVLSPAEYIKNQPGMAHYQIYIKSYNNQFGQYDNYEKYYDSSHSIEQALSPVPHPANRCYNKIAETPDKNLILGYNTCMRTPEKKELILYGCTNSQRTFFPYPLDVNFHSPQFHPHDPSFLVITEDNKVAVIAINNTIRRNILITEANAYCAMMVDNIPHTITSATFSPDGTQVAVGTHNGPVYIYDMQTQKCIAQTSVHAAVHGLTFSAGNKKLFVSHQLPDGLTCFDVAANNNRSLLITEMPTTIACSPTGEHLVYATTNPPAFTIVNQDNQQACTTPFPWEISDILFSPDNKVLKICYEHEPNENRGLTHAIYHTYYNFVQYKQREKILDQASGNDRYVPFVGKLCLPSVQAKSAEKTN